MQNQYIKEMLDLPELQIDHILPIHTDEVHIEVSPIAKRQCCPHCQSDEFVTRKGKNGPRLIRHLPASGKKVVLIVHSIRMNCSSCEFGFVWSITLLGPKDDTVTLFENRRLNKPLVLRLRTVPRCNRHLPVRYNECITMAVPLKVNAFPRSPGSKPTKVATSSWAWMTLPSKRDIPIIQAFMT